MNFANNQKNNYSSQRKGDTKPKKPLININASNVSRSEKVTTEKDKKGKNVNNKSKNQWLAAEEESSAQVTSNNPSLALQSTPIDSTISSNINQDPVVGEARVTTPQEPGNTGTTQQIEEKPVEKKAPETTTYQEHNDKSNYRNNDYNRKQYNQRSGNQNYSRRNNNYRDDGGYEDDYYYDDSNQDGGYGHQRNYNNNYNRRPNNNYYQPKKNYDAQEKIVYVKKT